MSTGRLKPCLHKAFKPVQDPH